MALEEAVAGPGDMRSAASAPTFAGLSMCPELVDACDAMGWEAPTRIQAVAIPHALQGRDLIALAQTGLGKTAMFTLPQPFFACVLVPARELAGDSDRGAVSGSRIYYWLGLHRGRISYQFQPFLFLSLQ